MKEPLLIVEDSAFFKKGQLIENYEATDDGAETEGNFLKESQFIVLKENMSAADVNIVKALIRKQLKVLLWNLYTKQNIIVGQI